MGMFTTNAPVAKFPRVGDSVDGEIVDAYRSQRYEYVRGGQGLPLYWLNKKPVAGARVDPATGKANDPVLQTVITLDTGVADENGDTERRIFIKNKRMETALKAAVLVAGGRRIGGLMLGGRLRCTWVGEEQGDGPSPAKVYDFLYGPPAPGTGREPSDEVRLADREPEAASPVRVAEAQAAGERWAAAPARTSFDNGPPGDRELAQAAAGSARAGIRDTTVTAGSTTARGALGFDEEPPF